MQIEETWRPIIEFDGNYDVSDKGRVRSWLRCGMGAAIRRDEPIVLSPKVDRHGYRRFALVCQRSGSRKMRLVHRLVLITFVGPCPKGMECCHWNGDSTDNRVENLRWDTRFGNKRDSARHGNILRGEQQHAAKLNVQKVREIRELAETMPLKLLAERFGVSGGTISQVVNRKTWKHVE